MPTVAVDQFVGYGRSLVAPISHMFSITPHDTDELASVTRALYVGTAGNVVVVTASGDEVTLNNLAAGVWHPMRIKQVKTATTAQNLIGGY